MPFVLCRLDYIYHLNIKQTHIHKHLFKPYAMELPQDPDEVGENVYDEGKGASLIAVHGMYTPGKFLLRSYIGNLGIFHFVTPSLL